MQSTLVPDIVRASDRACVETALASCSRQLDAALSQGMVAAARILDQLPRMEVFGQREQAIFAVTNEIARRLIAADLQRTADSFPDEVTVNKQRYRRHARGTVAYHTLCGDVAVHRDSYRLVGVHNGPTIIPLELEAGLVLGATPALAYSVADGIAELNSRRYEEILRAAGRCLPSRSTVNRLAVAIGGAAKQDVELIEPLLRMAETLPEGANAISVGLDRTTVPMAEEIPPAQAPKRRRSKPYIRKKPHPIEVKYRMAYVGTVAVVDSHGDMLRTWRFGATTEEGPDDLVRRMMAEVTHLRRQRALPVAIVQDGAPELWGLMSDGLRSVGIKHCKKVLDRFHVIEHMNAALEAAPLDNKGKFRERFIASVGNSDRKVGDFARLLWRTCHGTKKWRAVESHYDYLFMADLCGQTRYAKMQKLGIPTGSGITEGACKSLIAKRFKGSGQRWQQDGLTAILTLRALKLSERLPTFWNLFRNRYRAAIEC